MASVIEKVQSGFKSLSEGKLGEALTMATNLADSVNATWLQNPGAQSVATQLKTLADSAKSHVTSGPTFNVKAPTQADLTAKMGAIDVKSRKKTAEEAAANIEATVIGTDIRNNAGFSLTVVKTARATFIEEYQKLGEDALPEKITLSEEYRSVLDKNRSSIISKSRLNSLRGISAETRETMKAAVDLEAVRYKDLEIIRRPFFSGARKIYDETIRDKYTALQQAGSLPGVNAARTAYINAVQDYKKKLLTSKISLETTKQGLEGITPIPWRPLYPSARKIYDSHKFQEAYDAIGTAWSVAVDKVSKGELADPYEFDDYKKAVRIYNDKLDNYNATFNVSTASKLLGRTATNVQVISATKDAKAAELAAASAAEATAKENKRALDELRKKTLSIIPQAIKPQSEGDKRIRTVILKRYQELLTSQKDILAFTSINKLRIDELINAIDTYEMVVSAYKSPTAAGKMLKAFSDAITNPPIYSSILHDAFRKLGNNLNIQTFFEPFYTQLLIEILQAKNLVGYTIKTDKPYTYYEQMIEKSVNIPGLQASINDSTKNFGNIQSRYNAIGDVRNALKSDFKQRVLTELETPRLPAAYDPLVVRAKAAGATDEEIRAAKVKADAKKAQLLNDLKTPRIQPEYSALIEQARAAGATDEEMRESMAIAEETKAQLITDLQTPRKKTEYDTLVQRARNAGASPTEISAASDIMKQAFVTQLENSPAGDVNFNQLASDAANAGVSTEVIKNAKLAKVSRNATYRRNQQQKLAALKNPPTGANFNQLVQAARTAGVTDKEIRDAQLAKVGRNAADQRAVTATAKAAAAAQEQRRVAAAAAYKSRFTTMYKTPSDNRPNPPPIADTGKAGRLTLLPPPPRGGARQTRRRNQKKRRATRKG